MGLREVSRKAALCLLLLAVSVEANRKLAQYKTNVRWTRGMANAIAILGNGSYMVNLVSNKAIVNPDWIASTYDWSGTGGIPQTTATSAFTLDVGAIWYNAFQAATGFSGQVYGEDPGLQYSYQRFKKALPGISSVACSSPLQCVAVGAATPGGVSTVMKSEDGGISWSVVPFVTSSANFSFRGYTLGPGDNLPHADLNQVICPTASRCFAVGGASDGSNGMILFSSDEGRTWTEQTQVPFQYYAVYDPNALTGTSLYGTTAVSVTSCGGTNQTLYDANGNLLVNQPYYATPATCWEFGKGPAASATAVGNYYPTQPNVLAIDCDDSGDNCFAVTAVGTYGVQPGTQPLLLKTRNAGASWTNVPYQALNGGVFAPQYNDFTSVSVTSASNVWIGTNNSILYSTNGGATFTIVQPLTGAPNTAANLYPNILFVSMYNSKQGYAGGTTGSYNWFLKTDNGGASWAVISDRYFGSGSIYGWSNVVGNSGSAPFAPKGVAYDNVNQVYAYSFEALSWSPQSMASIAYTRTANIGQNGAFGSTGTTWPWLWLQELPHLWGTVLPYASVTQDQINNFKYGVSSVAVMPSIYKP